jgi:hypothetical protein
MGYKPDWQNQSAKKPAGHKCSPGIQSRELFHGAKMADGGILKGYADGGMPEPLREPTEADRGETSVADLPELREPTAADRGETAAPAKQSFGEAFKSAKDGSTFEWNGKQYKKEYAKAPAAKKSSYDIEDGKFMDVKPATPAPQPSGVRYGRGAVRADAGTPDTRTKEEKIKASRGGKFVQGRTPE